MHYKKILNHIEKAFRPIEKISIPRSKLAKFFNDTNNLLRERIEFTPEMPEENPELLVYVAIQRKDYDALLKKKSTLESWQKKIVAQDYDQPGRRCTVKGAAYDAAIFRIKLKIDEAKQMIKWFKSHPTIAKRIKDSLRMADPNTGLSGVEAFRQWINSDPNWNSEE